MPAVRWCLMMIVVAPVALAHDTYLVPDHDSARPGAIVSVHMTSGMEFPKLDYVIHPARVARASVIASGGRRPLEPPPAHRHGG